MRISYNWLAEYCNCPNIEELERDLNRIGFEVESIEEKGSSLSNIKIGKIQSFEPHPDADRLRIAQVDIGEYVTQIVTAADNVNEGDIIPVSLPGAILANGLKIKQSKLRGIESNGMMCSAVECGLTDDADGVWVLPRNCKVGEDFIKIAQLNDFILDVSVLPNRGDCLSIFGLARECQVLYGEKKIDLETFTGIGKAEIKLDVNKQLCSYYQATKITGIDKSTETPLVMQVRLYYCGMRPISWLVDVTNYVMLEYGQPLHAFDAAELNAIKVEIGENTSVDLLNEKSVSVEGLPVIKVNHSIGAIAGVMGALGSEISINTSAIVLESAIFNPIKTRKATKKLGLRSESSNRFEKGVDIFHLQLAVRRVIELLSNSSDITILEPTIINDESDETHLISFDIDKINNFLGTTYNQTEFNNRLNPLGFNFIDDKVQVPSWRKNDCKNWPDIAEEMIRFDGMDAIKSRVIEKMVEINHDPLYKFENIIRDRCIANGLTEVIPFPLISKDINEKQERLENPISEDLSTLRSNGFQSLLECIKFNSTRHGDNNQIFSIGPKWSESGDEEIILTVLIQGERQYESYLNSEYHTNAYNFYDSKGLVESIIQMSNINVERSTNTWLHPGQAANIFINDICIGACGVLHPSHQESYKCGKTIGVELNLSKLVQLKRKNLSYNPISKYPSTTRDVTYIMESSVSIDRILSVLNNNRPVLCKFIRCCGYYQPNESKDVNVSFRMTYQDDESSCNTELVNQIHKEFANSVISLLPCRFP